MRKNESGKKKKVNRREKREKDQRKEKVYGKGVEAS